MPTTVAEAVFNLGTHHARRDNWASIVQFHTWTLDAIDAVGSTNSAYVNHATKETLSPCARLHVVPTISCLKYCQQKASFPTLLADCLLASTQDRSRSGHLEYARPGLKTKVLQERLLQRLLVTALVRRR
jgi:hypothetical protein